MKTIIIPFFVLLSFVAVGQSKQIENTWFVESRSVNEFKKTTIVLTLDSIVKKIKDNDCIEVYVIKNNGTFHYSNSYTPTNPEMRAYLPSGATYSEGTWVLNSQSILVLTTKVKEKAYVYSYIIQRISDRKIILTEK